MNNHPQHSKDKEWLSTIANTRLIFNTMDELECMLDNHNIHSNGIKRCYNTPQKLRACYRDLKVEVDEMTAGAVSLDAVLTEYKRAWEFFKPFLSRRNNPETLALEILLIYFGTTPISSFGKKKAGIYSQMLEQKINIPFLVALLLKAIPGYDSKEGDIVDWNRKYEEVMALLERFTANGTLFASLPMLAKARNEKNKCRMATVIPHLS